MGNIEENEHENIILNFVWTGTLSGVLFHLIHTRTSLGGRSTTWSRILVDADCPDAAKFLSRGMTAVTCRIT